MDNRQSIREQSGEAPMEQVRELLFGAQLKDMELRFKRQEDRFLREIHDTRDFLKKRLDSLENFMKSEVSSLTSRLRQEQEERDAALKAETRERLESIKSESGERQEALKNEERRRMEGLTQITGDLNNVAETFERRLAKLASTIDVAERDLKALLLSESGSLNDKVESKYSDALSALAKTAAQIRSDMVYRSSLTSMFAEMVGGLSKPYENFHEESESASDEPVTSHYSNEQDEYVSEIITDVFQENHDEAPQAVHMGTADNY